MDNVSAELPKAVVPSVLKAARLLDIVAASRDPLPLSELSARLDLAKSSTLGLCTSLTVAGLLRRFDDGTYHLGTHLVDLAHAYLSRTDLTKEFALALDTLKGLDEDGAVLAVRDGTDVVYVACRNGNLPVGIAYRIGLRLPASCTATGKALLAGLDDAEIKALYRGKRLTRMTPHSHRTVAALLADLREVRRRGYALDLEEAREGMCCVGVPIVDPHSGQALAAVAVSILKGADSPKKRDQRVGILKELAGMLLNRLQLQH